MHKKILSGWGSATNAAGGAYDALPDLLVGRAGNTSPQNLVGDYGACTPVVQVRHKVKQTTPWYDADCRAARRRVRAAERRFRRTHVEADRRAWDDKVKTMRMLYETKKRNYWRDEIAASKGNTRRLWRTFHDTLGEVSRDETGGHTADDFAFFFAFYHSYGRICSRL